MRKVTIKYPSIMFIPWNKIKLHGRFRGSIFDQTIPIYWVDIPYEVDIDRWPFFFLYDEDRNDPWIPQDIIECLLKLKIPVVVFGPSDILEDIMLKFERNEVCASRHIVFDIHEAGNFIAKQRLYLQVDSNDQLYSLPFRNVFGSN